MAMFLVATGLIDSMVGSVMIIVAAFRKRLLWGLVSLFMPLLALVFVAMNGSEGKNGFLCMVGSLALVFIGAAMLPSVEASVVHWAL